MPRHLAEPIPVLVVASWFPSVDEPTRGRFVADQVTALAVSRRVEPRIVSFDTIMLSGEPPERRPQAEAMDEVVGRAIVRDDRVFSPIGMHGAPGVPLARIPVPAAPPDVPTDDPSRRRETALRSLAARVASAAVVHAHTAFPDGAASIELARRLGVPLLITEHASFVASILEDPPRRRAYLAAVEAASAFVAVSQTMSRELSDAIPGLAAKLVVIPNAVDVDAFRIGSAAERHPNELLYVGYRLETKGIATLLQAFQQVRRERPAATLRLIGRSVDQASEDRWQRMATELEIRDAVSFEPPALRPAVAEAMARASVLVHPSPRETFGMTAVEALASGTPVVAADSGGVTETLSGDESLGTIVPANDPAALGGAVLAALDRRETFDPDHLRASAVERFGAASVAARLGDLYERVMSEAPAGSAARSSSGGQRPGWSDPVPDVSGPRHCLVVGFATYRTQRLLSLLPTRVLTRAHVLCAPSEFVASLPDGIGDVDVVDLDASYRAAIGAEFLGPRPTSLLARVRRSIRDPLGIVRRRRIRSRRDRYRLAAGRAALESAISALTAEQLAETDVVGVDGFDFLVVSLVPAAAARLAPGGLRWVADMDASRGT